MEIVEKIEKGGEDIVFIYTICGGIEEARSMGYSAIREKLAISMDYWLINSIYPWQGVIQELNQYILMFSTQKILSDTLMKHLEAEHSYSIPMITRCLTDITNIPYSLWVENTLKNEDPYITETEEDMNKRRQEDIGFNKLK
jgi:uncharacterized protein involved in tolerance to divalent cations